MLTLIKDLFLQNQIVSNLLEIDIKNQYFNIFFFEADTLFIYSIIFTLTLIIYNLIFYYQIISLIFSIGALFFISGLYFAYLGGEFIGLTLILVYVGAILVLFLYFIMILDIKYVDKTENYYKHVFSLIIISSIIFFILNYLINYINNDSILISNFDINIISNTITLKDLGYTLYGIRVLDIIISGFILLVGVFGVIMLILQKIENRKIQDILRQVLNRKKY
jgi:NADH-quinone oxidoreductase subunit J